jgi:uncharacterized membrane protein YtjA (UPF0391 family)
MLRWALFYLAVTVITGGIGLWGPPGIETSVARVLAAASAVLFVMSMITALRPSPNGGGREPQTPRRAWP